MWSFSNTFFYYFVLFLNTLFFLFVCLFVFMAVLGLRFCARAFSCWGKWGPLLIAVRGPLTITASLVAEHRLQTRRPIYCGSRAQPLRGTWDPPRPGLEPVSPALAGRFSTTAPPGKPSNCILMQGLNIFFYKETENKWFQICGPYSLCCSYSALSL